MQKTLDLVSMESRIKETKKFHCQTLTGIRSYYDVHHCHDDPKEPLPSGVDFYYTGWKLLIHSTCCIDIKLIIEI